MNKKDEFHPKDLCECLHIYEHHFESISMNIKGCSYYHCLCPKFVLKTKWEWKPQYDTRIKRPRDFERD